MIRALEVIEQTGLPLSDLQLEHGQPAPDPSRSSPSSPPAPSCATASIEECIRFFEAGLVDEVAALMSAPKALSEAAAQAIGYREVIAMLAGEATLDQTIEQVQSRTRQFAKRQATWFRGLKEVRQSWWPPKTTPESCRRPS